MLVQINKKEIICLFKKEKYTNLLFHSHIFYSFTMSFVFYDGERSKTIMEENNKFLYPYVAFEHDNTRNNGRE